ncbi:MAG TPA: cytochrome c oxidase subunit 3 [Polyangiales bacterium]|nr:cytochrome c oxidase subunit 3 [Polyangiales bacterium]
MSAPILGEQYASLERQSVTLRFGMWLFLASELLLFSGLFVLYAAYRSLYGADFVSALHHNTLVYGTINMYVLLTSSFTVALSVYAVRHGALRRATWLVLASAALGIAFLLIKFAEYAVHIQEGALPGPYYRFAEAATPGGNRFYTLYWVTTGAHALHVTGGVGVLLWLAWHLPKGRYTAAYHPRFEIATLYWHFVDVMWLFIWPIFYLV